MPHVTNPSSQTQTSRKNLETTIKRRSSEHFAKLQIKKVVTSERKKLDKQWEKIENHLILAPGSELVEAVFASFALKYSKPSDTKLIASKMSVDQIPHEINHLIKRIESLPKAVTA